MSRPLASCSHEAGTSRQLVPTREHSREDKGVTKIQKKKKEYYQCSVEELSKNNRLQWIFRSRDPLKPFLFNSFLKICFSNGNEDENVKKVDEYTCRPMNTKHFTVNLKSFFHVNYSQELNSFNRIFFKFTTKVMTYSFFNKNIQDKFSFEKKHVQSKSDLPNARINNLLKDIELLPRVMIIFCKIGCWNKLMNVIVQLCERPSPKIPLTIWGGLVDEISICRFYLDMHFCKIDTDILFFSVFSSTLKGKICSLGIDCEDAEKIRIKLRKFKEKIILTSRSIAFMYTTIRRIQKLNTIDITIFKEVFPKVKLLTFCGPKSFTEHDAISVPFRVFCATSILLFDRITSILIISNL